MRKPLLISLLAGSALLSGCKDNGGNTDAAIMDMTVAMLPDLAPMYPKDTSQMFPPTCSPFGDTVDNRTFFLFLLKNATNPNSPSLMPGVPPGFVEPTCPELQNNSTPGSPRFNEQAYTWKGDPMMYDGKPYTLGMYAQEKATSVSGIDGTDMVLYELKATGLVPNAVYTLWFGDVALAMATNSRLAAVPFGKSDGSDNTFKPDANGELVLKNLRVAGGGKLEGIKSFSLSLHLDGKTYGPEPVPNYTAPANDPGQLSGITSIDCLWNFPTLKLK